MILRLMDLSNFVFIHLFLIMLIDQCWVVDVFSQRVNPDNQQHEIKLLRDYIEQEIERKQHHQVEQAMDKLVALMESFGYSGDQLSKQVQERIRYGIREKRFLLAYEAAMRWNEQHPGDLPVINLLGSVTTYMKRFREARDFLRTLYESDQDNEYYQERFLYVLRGLKDREEGVPLCMKILKNKESSPQLKTAAISGLIDLDLIKEPLYYLDQVEPFAGITSFRNYLNGMIAFNENRFEEALDYFQRVERGNARYMAAQRQVALCLFRLQQYREAAIQNLTILSFQLYDQNAYVNLAQSLARLKNITVSKTILGLQKKIEHNELPSKEGDYYWSKGDLVEYGRLQAIGLNSKFKFQEAERLLETICQIMPESISAKINLGQHYFTTLQSGKAEVLFRSLLNEAEDREKESIQTLLIEAKLRQGKIDDVLQMSEVANQDQMNALLGSYYVEMKHQPEQAIGYFEKIDDATYSIQVSYAKCLSWLNQPVKAIEIMKQIPDEFSNSDQKLIQVECLLQLERIDEAKQLFENILQKHNDLPQFLTVPMQAKLSKALKKDDAEFWQEKAGQLNELQNIIQAKVMEAQRIGLPDSVALFVELSDLFKEIGDHKNAMLFARRAYDAEPGQSKHLTRLIALLTENEQVIERYYLIQKAMRIKKITQNFEQELGEVFQVLGLNQLPH